MTELGWEALKIAAFGGVGFAVILGFCAYGLYRLGPEEEIPELKKKGRA